MNFLSMTPSPIENDPPFTFKYGGRYSQQLLPNWHSSAAWFKEGTTFIWEDTSTGLVVSVPVTKHEGTAREWFITFHNSGDEPTPILEDVWAMSVRIPGRLGWKESAWLHRLNGSMNKETDWLPHTTEMQPGSWLKFSPVGGHSSCGVAPFFNFEWDGQGVITAIGWTGQWRAEVAWGTKTEIRAGMQRMHLSLEPGESIRSPRILQLYWEGDIEDSYNRFRETMFKSVLPRVNNETVVAPIAHLSTAAYEWNWSTEEATLEHLEAVKDLGFETLWMDAYYFEGGFPKGMGNCGPTPLHIVDSGRFPRGLGYIGGLVKDAGMEWLAWMCFEAAVPGTWIDREHPDWLLSAGGQATKLVNLGLPEVQKYMISYIVCAIDAWGLDWLRIDCCPAPLNYWIEADRNPDRIGITEIKWVEGLYKILDEVLQQRPHLKIDNCDGGGRRIDLEMCKRTTPLWRTDYSTTVQENDGDWDHGAVLTQAMIAGLSRYVPFNSCGQFYEEPYWFRSGFNGGIGMLEDCRPEFYNRDRMKAAIEEAKRIRKYFYGDLYLLTDVNLDPTTWHAFQYHLPEEEAGMVLVFRRHKCETAYVPPLDLREIDDEAEYEAYKRSGYDSCSRQLMSGIQLRGWVLVVNKCPGSILIEYRRVNT